jgi:hypothetical protein
MNAEIGKEFNDAIIDTASYSLADVKSILEKGHFFDNKANRQLWESVEGEFAKIY